MSAQDYVLVENDEEDDAFYARQIMLLERHIQESKGVPQKVVTKSKGARPNSKNVPLDDADRPRKSKPSHRLLWR